MASKISFKIKLSNLVDSDKLDLLSQSTKKDILKDINEFAIDKILADTANQTSSVTGRRWKSLDPKSAYYKLKGRKGSLRKANMELTGDMLDALKGKVVDANTSEIGIFVKDQALKADGHTNAGVFGKSKLPPRKFMPVGDETLRRGIMKDIIALANEKVDEAPVKRGVSRESLAALAKEIVDGDSN